jgi:hypothetical protein
LDYLYLCFFLEYIGFINGCKGGLMDISITYCNQ